MLRRQCSVFCSYFGKFQVPPLDVFFKKNPKETESVEPMGKLYVPLMNINIGAEVRECLRSVFPESNYG
jgi:hypothetical protein